MGNIDDTTQVTTIRNYVLIGPQGSGKGTQAQILVDKYAYQFISSGNMLREITASGTPLGEKVKNTIEKGELISDDMLMEIVHEKIRGLDKSRGIIVDGTPRTLNQAKMLDDVFKFEELTLPEAINININRQAAIDRLTKRRTCTKCQTPYLPDDESALSGVCQKCGGKVITRADDNAEAIERRLDIYYKETEPVINYYYQSYRLDKVNGEQSIEDVAKEIDLIIHKHD